MTWNTSKVLIPWPKALTELLGKLLINLKIKTINEKSFSLFISKGRGSHNIEMSQTSLRSSHHSQILSNSLKSLQLQKYHP